MSKTDSHVLHLLQLAAHRVRIRTDRAALSSAGITTAQAGVLFVIAGRPGATQREIAAALRLRESAVTGMMARLHKLGLVERCHDASDQRARQWSLTARGDAALHALQGVLDEVNGSLTAVLGPAGLRSLGKLLRSINDAQL